MSYIRKLPALVMLIVSTCATADATDITRDDLIAWIAQGEAHNPPTARDFPLPANDRTE